MRLSRESRIPRSALVTTSSEVLKDGLRVLRAIRYATGDWMLLSGYESDESEPILVHFVHLSAVDPSLSRLRLRIGYYALRTRLGDDWYIYGAHSDAEIDEFLDHGIVDGQHNSL